MSVTFDLTPKARDRVIRLRDDHDEPQNLAFWIEVLGVRGTDFAYDLYFQSLDEADDGDAVLGDDQLAVVIPADSIDQLDGATLSMSRDLLNPGLVMDNPNQPEVSPAIADADLDLEGPVEDRIRTVLDRQINPQIAAHGGRADLADYHDGIVSLRLQGGCQGCSQAAATLRNGIEVALRGAIPEITEVRDVTDHAAGTNPYA